MCHFSLTTNDKGIKPHQTHRLCQRWLVVLVTRRQKYKHNIQTLFTIPMKRGMENNRSSTSVKCLNIFQMNLHEKTLQFH
jgi:hypothetical protein